MAVLDAYGNIKKDQFGNPLNVDLIGADTFGNKNLLNGKSDGSDQKKGQNGNGDGDSSGHKYSNPGMNSPEL